MLMTKLVETGINPGASLVSNDRVATIGAAQHGHFLHGDLSQAWKLGLIRQDDGPQRSRTFKARDQILERRGISWAHDRHLYRIGYRQRKRSFHYGRGVSTPKILQMSRLNAEFWHEGAWLTFEGCLTKCFCRWTKFGSMPCVSGLTTSETYIHRLIRTSPV